MVHSGICPNARLVTPRWNADSLSATVDANSLHCSS